MIPKERGLEEPKASITNNKYQIKINFKKF